MSDAVIACDTQMELIEFNPAAERLLGPTIRTLPIDQWAKHLDLVDEENGRKIGRDDWPLLRAARGEEFRSTWLLRQVDQKRWLEGCAAPIRDNTGSILGAAMIFRDITERQQSAAKILEAHDLAIETARLRSEFLTKMSHEIRTPLNGIIGMTQLLLDTELNDDQRDHLRTVGSSGNLLLRIVNDVLDFSKLTAGKVALEQSPFDLYEAVETTVETFAPRAQSQNIELILALSPDVPRDAQGNSRALTQVLSNLVSNAIEFTESGEVVVEVSRAAAADAPGAIRFAIRDTGIGIAPQARERLFDPFSQTDGSTRSRYGRSGLGLAISSRLVEAMGGRINLESQVGIGSTFSFTIGLIAAPDGPQRILEGPGLDGLKLLLAEANPTAREVLTARLRAWGIITETVATSEEAREAVRDKLAANQRYDFILIDATLPPIDGNDLARALRLVLEATPTRILMMGRAAAIHATEDHPGENADPQNPATNGREDASPNIDAWIRKPVRPSVLCGRLIAFAPPTDPARPIGSAGSHRPSAQRHGAALNPQGVRVLVIEDNPVNLKLALLQLKKLGYPASGAKTAREGLDALATGNFPIVLMDCEMPEIDGYAATREIRRGETGANHAIVIAMTAHAVEGAREKCLEAGMDDFLAKPVTLESLGGALERWAALIKHDSPATLVTAHFEAHASLDRSLLTEIRELSSSEDGDDVGELVTLFLSDLPAGLEKIAGAISANDLESAGTIAHRLKGACASMGATRLGAMCAMAESSARQGDRALLTTVLAQARAEVDQVRSLLESEQQRPAA
jgi:two-component system sensor histidine kinase/response regulator